MAILPFKIPQTKFRHCAGCAIPFRPAHVHHELCGRCYRASRWAAAFQVQAVRWRELVDGEDRRR